MMSRIAALLLIALTLSSSFLCAANVSDNSDVQQVDTEAQHIQKKFFQAVTMNQPKLLKRMIKAGAEVNLPHSESGKTALYIATENGNQNLVHLLLSKRPNCNCNCRNANCKKEKKV